MNLIKPKYTQVIKNNVNIPTLRDQFAMAALAGLCGLNWSTKDVLSPSVRDHAIQAYKYADAMIAVRELS